MQTQRRKRGMEVEDKNAKEIGALVRDEPVKVKDEEDEVGGIHPQTLLP